MNYRTNFDSTTWIDRNKIIVSEKSQHQKMNNKLFYVYNILEITTVDMENRLVAVSGEETGRE